MGSTKAKSRTEIAASAITFSQGTRMYSDMAPSRCTPKVWLNSQALGRAFLQAGHLPQLVYGLTVAFIPGFRCSGTPSPTDSMVAPISCPGMMGSRTKGFNPRNVFRSEPQKPTKPTFNNTCPGFISGFGSETTRTVAFFSICIAFIIDCLTIDPGITKTGF